MANGAAIVGWAHTPFGKLDDPDVESLIGRVAADALAHAGVGPADVDAITVGVYNNGFSKQAFEGSLVALNMPELAYVPATHLENACATGSAALYSALDFIESGRGRIALVIGAEKMTATPGAELGDILLTACYRKEEAGDQGFAGIFGRIAQNYFQRHGDRSEELAMIAAKNHVHGLANPLAHMRKDFGFDFCNTVSEKNPLVAGPLRRTDCSLVSDGAAALVVADAETAATLQRAISFRARRHMNDMLPLSRRDPIAFEGARRTWTRAKEDAGITIDDLDLVETHDCFTVAEMIEYEAMGLAEPGQGWRVAREGQSSRGGRLPVNLSGGLKSRGHPLGATGVSQHVMAAMQLMGEAGDMQLPGASLAGVFNMGGAAVANYVSILERSQVSTSASNPTGGVARVSRRVMNLAHILTQNARRHGSRPGFIWADRTWTWKEIEAEVSALAAGMAARGIGKGDRVLVHSKNCDEMFWSMFATFKIGAVWVPTNFRLMADEVAELAISSGAKAFLCHADFPEHAETVQARSAIEFTWRIGDAPFGETSLTDVIKANAGKAFTDVAVDHDDPCWFFFTSGTTGRSKASVLTHGQMAFVVTNHLCDLMPGTTESDASLVVAPLSHGAGVHQLCQAARAVPTILLPTERFDIDEAFRLIAKHRVTNMFTVPTILKMLVEHPAVDKHDHSSLRYIIYAGAPMYREDQKAALAKLGKVLVQYFGLGEVTGNITVLPPALHDPEDGPHARIGTCGFERTGMQVSIQDDNGRELQPFETGEICAIGPAVFAGYYENPDANAKAFRDGWFRTGDLGHMDEEGFVYITGRASDMYISGGSNIYPREVEEKVLTHPAIGEVAIVGVPDPVWGEVGIAVCVAREGMQVSEGEIAEYLAAKVPRYKMPKRFFFWEALPKSGYGKVPKRMVKDELEARGLLDAIAKRAG